MYKTVEALDREKHAKSRLPGETASFAFAAKIHSVPLLSVEFAETARCYPILFAEDAQKTIYPIALLGLRTDENLFVTGKTWDPQQYIPAFIRRYPFITNDDGVVAIDTDYVGTKGTGEAFFDAEGKNSPALENALKFLTEFQIEVGRTRALMAKLAKYDLLQDWDIQAVAPNGEGFKFQGLKIVNEKKLMEMKQEEVFDLFPTAELFWISAHLVSLGNVARLLMRVAPAN
ncbi:MAG: SapC family protein [Candidatus Pacebacteria bacterium]|nr:SapC family protein [Candidatus Paceibacterota bacterium]